MEIQKNYNLTELNTFGVKAKAKFFVVIKKEEDLKELFSSLEFNQHKRIFLGGGSNILFTKDFDGIVVLNQLKGMKIIEVSTPKGVGISTESVGENDVFVRAMGGENWHDLVMFTVERGYWGIENLALVPGTAGAAPIQNIGAYGAELNDVLCNVETYEIKTGNKKIFNKEECKLGYRDSIFKNELKGGYFISAITLKLNKQKKQNVTYKILVDYLTKNEIEVKTPKDISNAVISIRKSKLPDPKILGNVGSFFKNIFIEKEQLQNLKNTYPEVPFFEEEGKIKIPAGWLIEQCGPTSGTSWKGQKIGNVGVHEKQALVLVNYGGATGLEIMDLANKIIMSVKEKFGLELIPEVNIV